MQRIEIAFGARRFGVSVAPKSSRAHKLCEIQRSIEEATGMGLGGFLLVGKEEVAYELAQLPILETEGQVNLRMVGAGTASRAPKDSSSRKVVNLAQKSKNRLSGTVLFSPRQGTAVRRLFGRSEQLGELFRSIEFAELSFPSSGVFDEFYFLLLFGDSEEKSDADNKNETVELIVSRVELEGRDTIFRLARLADSQPTECLVPLLREVREACGKLFTSEEFRTIRGLVAQNLSGFLAAFERCSETPQAFGSLLLSILLQIARVFSPEPVDVHRFSAHSDKMFRKSRSRAMKGSVSRTVISAQSHEVGSGKSPDLANSRMVLSVDEVEKDEEIKPKETYASQRNQKNMKFTFQQQSSNKDRNFIKANEELNSIFPQIETGPAAEPPEAIDPKKRARSSDPGFLTAGLFRPRGREAARHSAHVGRANTTQYDTGVGSAGTPILNSNDPSFNASKNPPSHKPFKILTQFKLGGLMEQNLRNFSLSPMSVRSIYVNDTKEEKSVEKLRQYNVYQQSMFIREQYIGKRSLLRKIMKNSDFEKIQLISLAECQGAEEADAPRNSLLNNFVKLLELDAYEVSLEMDRLVLQHQQDQKSQFGNKNYSVSAIQSGPGKDELERELLEMTETFRAFDADRIAKNLPKDLLEKSEDYARFYSQLQFLVKNQLIQTNLMKMHLLDVYSRDFQPLLGAYELFRMDLDHKEFVHSLQLIYEKTSLKDISEVLDFGRIKELQYVLIQMYSSYFPTALVDKMKRAFIRGDIFILSSFYKMREMMISRREFINEINDYFETISVPHVDNKVISGALKEKLKGGMILTKDELLEIREALPSLSFEEASEIREMMDRYEPKGEFFVSVKSPFD